MSNPSRADADSLVEECNKARLICRQYYDTSASCPDNLQRIVSTVKDLHDILRESAEVLTSIHRSYPGQRSLGSRLNEIDRFIGKFCQLQEVTTVDLDHSPPQYRRIWTEPRLVFERRRAEQLYEGLRIENKKFIQFLFVLCLHAKFGRPAGPHTQHHGKLEPVASSIRAITQRLSELTYQVERRQNRAAQGDAGRKRALSLTDLEQQIDREWSLLCLRAGFEGAESRPPLPDSARNLLLSPSQIYHDMIIANHRDTTSRPLSASLRTLSTSDDSRGSQQIPPAGSGSTLGNQAVDLGVSQHHVILGEPALPLHVADFEMRPRQVLKLQSWRVTGDHLQKRIVWTGYRAGNELELVVNGQCIPYTLHSSLRETDKGLSVTFHGPSRIIWRKDGKEKLSESRTDVTYQFMDASSHKRFQEEFRDMHLVDTFNVESIRSQWSKSRFEAVNQDLKIWRSREDDTHTMSFFANHLKEHLEFSLDWLNQEMESLPVKQAVMLSFVSRASKSWRSSVKERLTKPSSKSAQDPSSQFNIWTAVGSSASSVRSSVSTAYSASSSSSNTSVKRVADMVEWADKFRSMTIQFNARPVGRSAKVNTDDDYIRFSQYMRNYLDNRSSA